MSLPFGPPLKPMLARIEDSIPIGDEWVYEPKWDGFRALVYRDGDDITVESRDGRDLVRYFPELVEALAEALPEACVLDGEIIVASPDGLDFNALLQRIHPAESRVRKLAAETPAGFVAFDLLAEASTDLRGDTLATRRAALGKALGSAGADVATTLTKSGSDVVVAAQSAAFEDASAWLDEFDHLGLDGVVAKRTDLPYVPGERVMVKVKQHRTADCVVAGYRLNKTKDGIGSLLLGLFDSNGVLHYAGHTSSFKAAERRALLEELKPLETGHSFGGGRSPGGPSRWSAGRDSSFVPLELKLVCEVHFDRMLGDRFRHATRFLRWRPDKKPEECTYDQVGGRARLG